MGFLDQIPGGVAAEIIASAAIFSAGFGVRGLLSRMRRRKEDRISTRYATYAQPAYTAAWIRRYYLRADRIDDLFLAQFDEGRARLPILTKSEWTGGPFLEEEICLATARPPARSTVAEDDEIVAQRRRFIGLTSPAEQLWNEDLLCAKSISVLNGAPRLEIIVSSYFQYLSACGRLENETYRAVADPRSSTTVRDETLRSADAAAECALGANGLGMQVAFVFKVDGEFKVLVQRRSMSVATYAGALAVVPVFGCQPYFSDMNRHPSLFHNFLREYYEELYAAPEVIMHGSHVSDEWFYSHEPITALRERLASQRLVFELLGVGVDALNGEVNIAAMALVLDEEFYAEEFVKMKTNWEIQEIDIVSVSSPKLRHQILSDQFQPGSAFALCLTLERLEKLRGDGVL